MRNAANAWSPVKIHTIDTSPLSLISHSIFHLTCCHPSKPYLTNLAIKILLKIVSKALLKYSTSTAPPLIHRARHNITEGNQAAQEGSALSQSFLTIPNALIVYKPVYYVQKDLPHNQFPQPSRGD